MVPHQLIKPHPTHKLYTVKYAPPDSGGRDEIGIRTSPDPSVRSKLVRGGTPDYNIIMPPSTCRVSSHEARDYTRSNLPYFFRISEQWIRSGACRDGARE